MSTVARASAALLMGMFIFVGWPLVAWGLGDIPRFFENPARLGYVATTLVTFVVIIVLMPNAGRSRGQERLVIGRQRIALALMQVLSLSLVVTAPFCDRRDLAVLADVQALRYVGLALYVLGLIGIHWSEAALGKQFSVQVGLQEDHRLITHGPYRYFRHPRYLSILMFSSGFALLFRSWLGLATVACMAAVLMWRAYDEETLLHREFGEDWETYARKTWGLIPFVH